MVSGDDVSIQAANTNNPNVPASEVLISAGSGTNKIGGSGGDVIMLAGNAAGGEFYPSFEYYLLALYILLPVSSHDFIRTWGLHIRHSHGGTYYWSKRW